MSKKLTVKFRGRQRRGEGNSDISKQLTAEQAHGLKVYQVWQNGLVVREVQAESFQQAQELALGLWVSLKV